jgi:hypothetical protein
LWILNPSEIDYLSKGKDSRTFKTPSNRIRIKVSIMKNLTFETEQSITQLNMQLGKLHEAKGSLPEKQAKKYAKLIETLTNLKSETEAMLEDLDKRTHIALERNFYHYSVKVFMILSNGVKPTLETSTMTDNHSFNVEQWIKEQAERCIKDNSERYYNGATLVSYTFNLKKTGKK